MTELVFWISVGFVGYVYAGYPLLLLAWSRFKTSPVARGDDEPPVSIVIAARNERRRIEEKLRNCLALDYPRNKLQIVLSLDGPTDGTERVLRHRQGGCVEIVHSPVHRGKAAALNAAVERARGEILVFTDARQRLDAKSIRRLVRNFGDASVGAVSGKLVLSHPADGEAKDGLGLYWRYERRIRMWESRVHSVVGATGALYAVRRSSFRPLAEQTILDDVAVPLSVVLSGHRVVFDDTAHAFDEPPGSLSHEFRRKVRTLTGNYQLLQRMPALLDPARNPIFLQFVSHKVGRLLAPYFLLSSLVSNFFLTGGFYAALLSLQLAVATVALLGLAMAWNRPAGARSRTAAQAGWPGRVLLFPATFLLMNWAAVVGLYYFVIGGANLQRRVWGEREPVKASLIADSPSRRWNS